MSSRWSLCFTCSVAVLLWATAALAGPSDLILTESPTSQDEFLLLAAHQGNLNDVQQFLAQGANVNSRHEHGTTPLIVAVHENHAATVHHLLENGAETDVRDGGGTPLLFHALYRNNTAVLLDLLTHQADPNARNSTLSTPLMMASGEGRLDQVKLLIAYGANCTARDVNGNTALHYALVGGHQQVAQVLALCAPQEQMQ